jgi:hypothetical protein
MFPRISPSASATPPAGVVADAATGPDPGRVEACLLADRKGRLADAAAKVAADFEKLCTGPGSTPRADRARRRTA